MLFEKGPQSNRHGQRHRGYCPISYGREKCKNAMMAAATATKPRNKIGNGTRGSLLPTYSMLLSFISGLLPPRGRSDSVTGLFDGDSGFLVGMVLNIKAN